MIYGDASALVKKYLSETGSDTVRQWLAKDPGLVTSQLAYAEIHATFAAKERIDFITVHDAAGSHKVTVDPAPDAMRAHGTRA